MKRSWILFRTEHSNIWYFYTFQNPFDETIEHPICVSPGHQQERWFPESTSYQYFTQEEAKDLNAIVVSKKRTFKIKGQPQRFILIQRGETIIDN